MFAFSLDNLLFLLLIAVAALFQLLSKAVNKTSKSKPDETSSSNISGYVWNAIVGMIDLNTLLAQSPPAGWRIINAETINNHGQIGAMVSVNGGPDRAVLLTPSVSGVPL